MVTFKDISIYFKASCCNKIDSNPLSNLSPKKSPPSETLEKIYKKFSIYSYVDLQEICVTFSPKKYGEWNNTRIHNFFKKTVIQYCNKYSYFEPSYLFIPEFQKNGMVHYHGIMYFNNANDYWVAEFKRMCSIKFGITAGKTVHNIENYWKYITKDTEQEKFTILPFHYTGNLGTNIAKDKDLMS